MTDKQLIKNCKRIISKEQITFEEFEYCKKVLNTFLKIDNNNDVVYVLLGKLFLIKNNTKKSK